MKVRRIEAEARVGARRGEAVVCISASGDRDQLGVCLRSVAAHTPANVRILIYEESGAGSGAAERAGEDGGTREVIYLPGRLASALAAAAPADVVVVSSRCVVAEGWFDGLREAAHGDSTVATASALSMPGLSGSLGPAAAAVRARSLRVHPRVATPAAECMYVRRSALELVDGFDEGGQFAERCLERGLSHVVADDVLVSADGTSTVAVAESRLDPMSPLARSLGAARRALDGLSLAVDARILSGPMNGTRLHVLELIAALARNGGARVEALVPVDIDEDARDVLEALPQLTLSTVDNAPGAPSARAHVVHRPFQIAAPADLTFLAQVAERLIITHQDLIGYHNMSYFRSRAEWEGHRRLTRRALAVADRVLFFSAHARDDALAEGLVEPHRASVVHIGVDHAITRLERPPAAPASAARLPDGVEVMLCLGTDFRHKNRMFAIRLLEELQHRHGWHGWLVLAGPRVTSGSSRPEEQRFLTSHPGVQARVLDIDAVSEAEKVWLFGRANLVLYPTVHEGFGLVPFEAADHGVPCLWAQGTSLSEVLPDAAAGIVPWDLAPSAGRAIELMRDGGARARNVQAVRTAAAGLRWDATAERLIGLYHAACDDPPTPASARERIEGVTREGFSEDAVRLVGPDGILPRELERPLLALATHRRLGAPLFGAIKAGYRASYRWRRGGPSRNGSDP